ncbi:hypothetical protein RFI_38755, partial [Reticulomyxa filosa]
MGTHITKIRSFRLDTNAWTDEITETFEKVGGNEKVNTNVWEALLPSYWMNPKWDRCEAVRDHFIRMKYENRMFLPPDPTKLNPCVRKMPVEVMQGSVECKSPDAKKWSKQWGVLHSRYTGPKQTEAKAAIDLAHCKLIVEEQDSNDLSSGFKMVSNFFFLSIFFFSPSHPFHIYSKKKIINKCKNIGSAEPWLACRVVDFQEFNKWVTRIRMATSFYRVFDILFEVEPEKNITNVNLKELQSGNVKHFGWAKISWAKIGWSKRWFCFLNGNLYCFQFCFFFIYFFNLHIACTICMRIDITQMGADIAPPHKVFDLQLTDFTLDEDGQRSGSKNVLLLFHHKETFHIRFDSGPEAVKFYSDLNNCWKETRGRFTVDFADEPPVITGEAIGNDNRPLSALSPRLTFATPEEFSYFFKNNKYIHIYLFLINPLITTYTHHISLLNSQNKGTIEILELINEIQQQQRLREKELRQLRKGGSNDDINFNAIIGSGPTQSEMALVDGSGANGDIDNKLKLGDNEDDDDSDEGLYRGAEGEGEQKRAKGHHGQQDTMYLMGLLGTSLSNEEPNGHRRGAPSFTQMNIPKLPSQTNLLVQERERQGTVYVSSEPLDPQMDLYENPGELANTRSLSDKDELKDHDAHPPGGQAQDNDQALAV